MTLPFFLHVLLDFIHSHGARPDAHQDSVLEHRNHSIDSFYFLQQRSFCDEIELEFQNP